VPTFVAVCIAVAVDKEMAVPGVADTTVTPFTYIGAETTVADGSIPEGLCIAVGDCAANSDPAQPIARMAVTSIIHHLVIAFFTGTPHSFKAINHSRISFLLFFPCQAELPRVYEKAAGEVVRGADA
jgi:hypothetical protein